MKQTEKADWERAKAKGPLRYILMRGVLGWGVPMAVFVLAAEYFIFHRTFEFHEIVMRSVVFLMGGVLSGALDWKWTESRYRRAE